MSDTAGSINSLVTVSNALLELLKSPEALAMVVVVVVISWAGKIFSKDFSYLFDLYERKEKKRVECIEKYMATKELANPESLKLIQELRDNYYFGAITGFHAEKDMRKAIANLYSKTSHKVQWKHILRARPHIELNENGNTSIAAFSWFDRIQYWYNEIWGGLTFLGGFGLLISFVVSSNKTFTAFAWYFLGFLISVYLSTLWALLDVTKLANECCETNPKGIRTLPKENKLVNTGPDQYGEFSIYASIAATELRKTLYASRSHIGKRSFLTRKRRRVSQHL